MALPRSRTRSRMSRAVYRTVAGSSTRPDDSAGPPPLRAAAGPGSADHGLEQAVKESPHRVPGPFPPGRLGLRRGSDRLQSDERDAPQLPLAVSDHDFTDPLARGQWE